MRVHDLISLLRIGPVNWSVGPFLRELICPFEVMFTRTGDLSNKYYLLQPPCQIIKKRDERKKGFKKKSGIVPAAANYPKQPFFSVALTALSRNRSVGRARHPQYCMSPMEQRFAILMLTAADDNAWT